MHNAAHINCMYYTLKEGERKRNIEREREIRETITWNGKQEKAFFLSLPERTLVQYHPCYPRYGGLELVCARELHVVAATGNC